MSGSVFRQERNQTFIYLFSSLTLRMRGYQLLGPGTGGVGRRPEAQGWPSRLRTRASQSRCGAARSAPLSPRSSANRARCRFLSGLKESGTFHGKGLGGLESGFRGPGGARPSPPRLPARPPQAGLARRAYGAPRAFRPGLRGPPPARTSRAPASGSG